MNIQLCLKKSLAYKLLFSILIFTKINVLNEKDMNEVSIVIKPMQ